MDYLEFYETSKLASDSFIDLGCETRSDPIWGLLFPIDGKPLYTLLYNVDLILDDLSIDAVVDDITRHLGDCSVTFSCHYGTGSGYTAHQAAAELVYNLSKSSIMDEVYKAVRQPENHHGLGNSWDELDEPTRERIADIELRYCSKKSTDSNVGHALRVERLAYAKAVGYSHNPIREKQLDATGEPTKLVETLAGGEAVGGLTQKRRDTMETAFWRKRLERISKQFESCEPIQMVMIREPKPTSDRLHKEVLGYICDDAQNAMGCGVWRYGGVDLGSICFYVPSLLKVPKADKSRIITILNETFEAAGIALPGMPPSVIEQCSPIGMGFSDPKFRWAICLFDAALRRRPGFTPIEFEHLANPLTGLSPNGCWFATLENVAASSVELIDWLLTAGEGDGKPAGEEQPEANGKPPNPVTPLAAGVGTGGGEGKTIVKTTKGKRGRKKGSTASDQKEDQRITDAWNKGQGQYTTHEQLANAFHMEKAEVVNALDRHRKRVCPAGKNSE